MLKFNEYLEEQKVHDHIKTFMDYAMNELEIAEKPKLQVINDKKTALINTSFGGYAPDEKTIYLNIAGRHVADILRTLGHELVHHKQNLDGILHQYAGETGSEFENEANSKAGVLMRNFGKTNPAIYEEFKL